MKNISIADIYYAILLTLIAVQFVRWMGKRIVNDQIQREFVSEMATVHLPFIYKILRQLCEANGIDSDEPPAVNFVQVNGNGHSKKSLSILGFSR